jgi:hypothetical protein
MLKQFWYDTRPLDRKSNLINFEYASDIRMCEVYDVFALKKIIRITNPCNAHSVCSPQRLSLSMSCVADSPVRDASSGDVYFKNRMELDDML